MIRKVAVLFIAGSAAYLVYTQPEQAADLSRGAVEVILTAMESVVTFVESLF